jgi:hypothetical protein
VRGVEGGEIGKRGRRGTGAEIQNLAAVCKIFPKYT